MPEIARFYGKQAQLTSRGKPRAELEDVKDQRDRRANEGKDFTTYLNFKNLKRNAIHDFHCN